MRGKVASQYEGTRLVRITPAYAGKSVAFSFCLLLVQDHPRLCGEKLDYVLTVINFQGSPPPMRGKGGVNVKFSAQLGITPAYAGKRSAGDCPMYRPWDHPRLCGEKRNAKEIAHLLHGITPAYAGKSGINCNQIPVTEDHPRLCGEKLQIPSDQYIFQGSPPPMRGKGVSHSSQTFVFGITPAYAGKSHLYGYYTIEVRDHPRLCGEKSFTPLCESLYIGSPPPMRGKACTCGKVHGKSRITPAYAGKSRAIPSRSRRFWDHPRLCGEK